MIIARHGAVGGHFDIKFNQESNERWREESTPRTFGENEGEEEGCHWKEYSWLIRQQVRRLSKTVSTLTEMDSRERLIRLMLILWATC